MLHIIFLSCRFTNVQGYEKSLTKETCLLCIPFYVIASTYCELAFSRTPVWKRLVQKKLGIAYRSAVFGLHLGLEVKITLP